MQQKQKTFNLSVEYSSIYGSLNPDNSLIITLAKLKEGVMFQKVFQKGKMPSSSKYQYTSGEQLYAWLENSSFYPSNWTVKESVITVYFQKDNILAMQLGKISDAKVANSIILKECWEAKQSKEASLLSLSQDLASLRSYFKDHREEVNHKLEQIGAMMQTIQKQCDKIDPIESKVESLRQKSSLNNNQQGFQSTSMSYELNRLDRQTKRIQKRMQEDISRAMRQIQSYIQKNDLDKLKKELNLVNQAFENEIRIKNYEFKPNPKCVEINKKILFLNNKTLKCNEESKDYAKVSGIKPFPIGKYYFRIYIKNIKNNGLMLGVCNKKAYDNLQYTKFNDSNIISINSCGYVFNRSMMSTFSGRIKSGDIVKMMVNLHLGEIRWYCNDMELIVVDCGQFKKEEVFPLIGLGNFCDEVDLIPTEQFSSIHEGNELYKYEVQQLNNKFGRKYIRN